MNWDAIGAVGEIAGAVAVVISLVYLASQIRQTNMSVTANTHQALNDISIQLYLATSTSESLAIALGEASKEESELTNAQIQQCYGFWTAMIRNAENMHFQHKLGLLDKERIRASSDILKRLMRRNTHFQRLWGSLDSGLRPEFRDWMETVFDE